MNSANQMAEEIYGLHCDIGRLEKLVKHWKTEFIDEQDYAKMMELEADKAKAENAKLRELAAGIGHLLFSLDVDYCAACPRNGINHSCPVYTIDGGECLYKTDLRELGMEVDE